MIRHNGEYRLEQRVEMRGGKGAVRIEHLLEPAEHLTSATRLFARLTLDPGVSIGVHVHDGEEEIFHILSGRGEFDDNGKTVPLVPGDTTVTGGGASHGIANTAADQPLVVLATILKSAAK